MLLVLHPKTSDSATLFDTASIILTVFNMHSFGFLWRETKPEWKSVLKMPRYSCMSLYKPKAVHVAM